MIDITQIAQAIDITQLIIYFIVITGILVCWWFAVGQTHLAFVGTLLIGILWYIQSSNFITAVIPELYYLLLLYLCNRFFISKKELNQVSVKGRK